MKTIGIVFPKDSEAVFNRHCRETFGGATVQLYLIAKELNNYPQIKVVSLVNQLRKIDFDDAGKFNLVQTYRPHDGALTKIIKFHRRLRQVKPDILIQRGLSPFSCFLALYCRIFRINFVFMFAHDREAQGRYQGSNKLCKHFNLLLEHSRLLIVQSEEQIKLLNGKHRHKFHLLFSGNEIKPLNGFMKEFILWVGRVEEWKRPDLFIRLAQMNPGREFVMIAPPAPSANGYYDKIVSEAKKIPNLLLIDFVGFHEIDSYFEKAQVFVNTSEEEGFPNTFIQACKSKTPILSMNINPGNFLHQYNCGIFCDGSIETLNDSLNNLLRDASLYADLAESAYRNSWENHDIRVNVMKLLDAINPKPVKRVQ